MLIVPVARGENGVDGVCYRTCVRPHCMPHNQRSTHRPQNITSKLQLMSDIANTRGPAANTSSLQAYSDLLL